MTNSVLYDEVERKLAVARLRKEYGHPLDTDQPDDLIPKAKTPKEIWAKFRASAKPGRRDEAARA